jgi:hypothetical protein
MAYFQVAPASAGWFSELGGCMDGCLNSLCRKHQAWTRGFHSGLHPRTQHTTQKESSDSNNLPQTTDLHKQHFLPRLMYYFLFLEIPSQKREKGKTWDILIVCFLTLLFHGGRK